MPTKVFKTSEQSCTKIEYTRSIFSRTPVAPAKRTTIQSAHAAESNDFTVVYLPCIKDSYVLLSNTANV